jgi:uncharacterized delta-60 repeat protein
MALNSTGTISLGGTTTGQSVSLELGRSSTATISLNDTAVRTLAGVASGAISLYNLYGKSNVPYWIGILGGSAFSNSQGITVDSSGNVYICGYSNASGTTDFQIAKYNTSGTIQWQKRLGGVAGRDSVNGSVFVDSSGNVYVCGYSSASGTNDFQIAKYNTSGTIQWQKRLGGSGTDIGMSVAVDSSGNVYVGGYSSSSNSVSQLAKYNSSGTIQWQRQLSTGTADSQIFSIALDSSGNIYACGRATYYSPLQNDLQIIKLNSSGAIQWQRSLGASLTEVGFSVTLDSSGNVYVCGYSSDSGTQDFQIAKYNNSGTIQWQRRLGGSSSEVGTSVAVDSSSNVYVCGYSNASGSNDFQIAKYNTSGTIQWQRRLGSSSEDYGYSIASDLSGNIYICGNTYIRGNADFLFAKLPNDGSLTGTYTVGGYSFTYAASSLTDAASSLTDVASSLTDAASSLTDAASSLTDASSSLTSSVTTI